MIKLAHIALSGLLLTSGFWISSEAKAQTPNSQPVKIMAQSSEDAMSQEMIAKAFLEALDSQEYNLAWDSLHPSLQQDWNLDRMQEMWADMQSSLGEYEGYTTFTETENVVAVTVKFAKMTDELLLIFDEDHHIIGLDFPQDTWDMIGE